MMITDDFFRRGFDCSSRAGAATMPAVCGLSGYAPTRFGLLRFHDVTRWCERPRSGSVTTGLSLNEGALFVFGNTPANAS
jgi:hypothetical protein